MTDYTVKLSSQSKKVFKVQQVETKVFKVQQAKTSMPENFVDLGDVSISNLDQTKNNYAVVYDATKDKFVIVDPDVVLSAASQDSGPQPGIPDDFIDTLDVDLDNRIDIDAGTF